MRRALWRLAWSVIVVWAAASIAFALNELLPGDPARALAGPQARAEDVARLRDQLGLDRPPLVRYARFWAHLLHAAPASARGTGVHATCASTPAVFGLALHVDFGKSFELHQPVVDLVGARLPRTMALAAAGVFVQLLLGVATGCVAAVRRGTRLDRWLVATSLLGVSVPTFLIALALQSLFAQRLGWLPLDGFGEGWTGHARAIVLPAMTLGLYGAAYYTRLTRDEVIVALRRDWVRTARAKGASPWRVLARHALRNALLTVLTSAGLDLGALMGGAVITETVFRWPGLGELSVRATRDRDAPVLLACVLVTSTAVVGATLLVDALYARLDPRVTGPRAPGSH